MPKSALILGRLLVIVGSTVVLAVVLKLIGLILGAVLYEPLRSQMLAGFNLLYSLISPALPAVIALGILFGVIWVFTARHHR